MAGMRMKRNSWMYHWRELADYILPRRYRWLVQANQANRGSPVNYNIKDSTGTIAARVLASGMMAGITSPTRPWFKLKIQGFEDDQQVAIWLAECERRLMTFFAESNFYTAMAVMYFDLVVFGTALVLIYEDFDNVIHCVNPALGEYFFELNDKFEVDTIAREFTMTASQIASKFGLDNVSEDVKQSVNAPTQAARSTQEKLIMHVIEPHKGFTDLLPKLFKYREIYWEGGSARDKILQIKGFHEFPAVPPRWNVTGNNPYGDSVGMDALGDVKQLQQETIRKAQAIDKMVNPPMLADVQLKNQPASLLPGGVTYIAGMSSGREGMKPIYQVMPPVGEMMQDIREIQSRIKITFHNDLFTGITDLQTVRTATEIDARREEKLVLLGPVLERILDALSMAVDRTWGIATRGGLMPPPPPQLQRAPTHIEVDYISMLALAQRGLATAAIEKAYGFAGNLVGIFPEIKAKFDIYETIDEYADALGVSPKLIVPTKDAQAAVKAEADAAKAKEDAAMMIQGGGQIAQAGKTLSETEVGGGANALDRILGTA
jgi:hypothetical protein